MQYRTLTVTLNHCSHTTVLVRITAIRNSACPTPDSSVLIDLDAPVCRRLISRAFSPHEMISLVEAIFTRQDEVKIVDYLRGDDVQTFIDVIDEVHPHIPSFLRRTDYLRTFRLLRFRTCASTNQAIDLPTLSPRLRRNSLNLLSGVCGVYRLLPRSLHIPLCYDRLGTPLYRGGYADVWKGEHQGRPVAVKVLRVYLMDDFNKILSVGYHNLSKSVREPTDADH